MAPTTNATQTDTISPAAGRRADKRTVAGIVGFILVSMFLGWVGMAYDENMQKWLPETTSNPSAYNKKQSGTSGLLEIATKTGMHCRMWLLPYRQLQTQKGTLCVFSPVGSLQDFEVEQILHWVKTGNRLIYLDHFNYSLSRHLLQKLHIDTIDGDKLKDAQIKSAGDIDQFTHVKSLTVSTDTRLKGGTALLEDKSGTLITKLPYGKGEIILGTVPNLCANSRLTEKGQWGNFQFLINLCRPFSGELMFDERCHGYSKSSNVLIFLAKSPSGFVFGQTLLILALALFGSFHRFGKTRELKITRRLSSADFIEGLSNVYRRARANLLAAEIISRSYRTNWCKITNTSSHDTEAELKEKWVQQNAGNEQMNNWSQTAGDLLEKVSSAQSDRRLSDSELLSLANGLESSDQKLKDIFAVTTGKQRKGASK